MSNIYDKASLVLIPSGTKTSKVYSQKPTNGDGDFTFSRSTAATRVNADGNIEKETANEILQSNTFDVNWGTFNLTSATGGQSGYDGSSDAWLLTPTASTGQHDIRSSVTGSSGVYTWSAYVKAGGKDFAFLQCVDSVGGNFYGYFNLSDGSSTSNNYGNSGSIIQTTTESVGGGWYRLSMVMSGNGATSARIGIASAAAGGAHSTTLSATDTIYIQDAQLEQGLVARDYIETTTPVYGGITDNVPRLDYTDSSCPALLLEPQRVNLFNHSELLGGFGSGWTLVNGLTTEPNSIDSPEGVQNATKLIRPANTNAAWVRYVPSITQGKNHTISVFAKEGNEPVFCITYYDVVDGDRFFNFNLSTQTITGSGLSHDTYVDSDMIDYGNGWYRCYIVVEAGWSAPQIQLAVGSNRGAQANEYVYVYGAQIEDDGAGNGSSYATSYIPTYGSAVTRNDDNCKVGYNAIAGLSEATLVVEYEQPIEQPSGLNHIAGYRDNANADFYILQIGNSNNHELRWRGQNGINVSLIAAIDEATYGLHRKIAFVKTNDKLIAYCNGVKVNEVSAGSTNAFSTNTSEELDLWYSGFVERNDIKQLLVIPSALSNQEAIDLTTL